MTNVILRTLDLHEMFTECLRHFFEVLSFWIQIFILGECVVVEFECLSVEV